jgi:Ca-activated chloride channel homolog
MNRRARKTMSMKSLASALTGIAGERVALCDVAVTAALRDLLAQVTVAQTYRNDERINIEAVYTLPLPLDALLLELQVDIGGRVLNGIVVGKQEAEEAYEDAVDSGDAAVMLQEIEPGLYTMNVGNLLPGEQATITFTYAMVYKWNGDRLRFFLPTTVAPRYGASPHQPHQVPEASLAVENQFSLQVEISGSLREAQCTCPSHEVKQETFADKVVISLQQARAVMDRDFILNIRAPQATRCFVQCGADGEGAAAMASFQPFFPGLQQLRPLNLAIVVDCSGSMGGNSMEQAKQALKGIVDALQPHDRITIIAFGNTTIALSDGLLPCNKTNLAKARSFAKQLDANMGGTEIAGALEAAYATVQGTEPANIFLVTDGEVARWQNVVQQAKLSGHRIFTVGVGSAVSEAFVRGLATATGGECELVAPREGMSDRVIRHFERMRSPRAKHVSIHWPEGARDLTPATVGAVFEGDTINVSARFDQPPASGAVALEVETESGDAFRQDLPLSMPPMSESASGISTIARGFRTYSGA